MVKQTNVERIRNILLNYQVEHPGKEVPESLKTAIDKAQEELSIFESGAGRKLSIWNLFKDFKRDNNIAGISYPPSEIDAAARDYIQSGECGIKLSDEEMKYFTNENYTKNKKVKISKFIKEYRVKNDKGGIKDFFRKFKEAQAEANKGSLKHFLHTEYPNAAHSLQNSIIDAEILAENIDTGMYNALDNKVSSLDLDIKRVKQMEKDLFGNPAGRRIMKAGLVGAGIGLVFLGARWIYKQIKADNRKLAYTGQQQPSPNNKPATDTIAEAQSSDSVISAQNDKKANTAAIQQDTTKFNRDSIVEQPKNQLEQTNETVNEKENETTQLPFILTTLPKTDSVQTKPEAYTPIAPYPYTMDYPAEEVKPAVIEEAKTPVTTEETQKTEPEINANTEKEVEQKKETSSDATTRAERRAAFNNAINEIKATLSTEGIKCDNYTIVKNDTLSKIAMNTLKNEGIAKPTVKEINERIALIALLNEIEDVNKLWVNQTIKIPSAELISHIKNNPNIQAILNSITKEYV